MKQKLYILLLIVGICAGFRAAQSDELSYPDYFPTPAYDFEKNPLSAEKVELGRMLFYDPILSKDNSISCASCHSPYNAFAHTDHDLSHGIDDQIGTRNAPALFNLAWYKTFMWDGAINHLDVQALGPITNELEMGEDLKNVVAKLQNTNRYPQLFQSAFGDSVVTGEYILKALSQFQLMLVSANAKYDRVKQGKEQFTAQEQNGYELFKVNCGSCHTEPLFTNNEFANNGLPVDTTLNDYGRYTQTHVSKDSMQFKVPSLRNLSFSPPYMHDGRFRKLHQVIEHYTSGISHSATLADQLRDPITLSAEEKVDLVAFLLTLSDKEFVFNSKHQYPRTLLQTSTRLGSN